MNKLISREEQRERLQQLRELFEEVDQQLSQEKTSTVWRVSLAFSITIAAIAVFGVAIYMGVLR